MNKLLLKQEQHEWSVCIYVCKHTALTDKMLLNLEQHECSVGVQA